MSNETWRPVFGPQVVHETIDHETVIIDFATGSYFSLEGAGSKAWQALFDGADAVGAAGVIADGDDDAALAAVLVLGRRLYELGIITNPPPDPDPSVTPLPLPGVRSYDDLQAHLLADPIHQVERGAGWPAIDRP